MNKLEIAAILVIVVVLIVFAMWIMGGQFIQ
jgi:hypothetical protein